MKWWHKPLVMRDGLSIFISCVLLATLGLFLVNGQRHTSERKFCKIVSYSRNVEQRKLDAYDENPPLTEAGRAQQDEVRISLRNYIELEHSLGCT